MYYSKSINGFYDQGIHGARRITIADPAWVRPLIDVVLQPGETYDLLNGTVRTNDGDVPITLVGVPDVNAGVPTVEIDNPDCKIPADAVEITDEQHAALLEGQSRGETIRADENGHPVLAAPTPVPFETLKAAELKQFRSEREQFLNRLAGIGLAAQFAGQSDVLASTLAVRQGLLDLTTHPTVVAATDLPGLKAAMKNRYLAILGDVPAVVFAAFRGVDA